MKKIVFWAMLTSVLMLACTSACALVQRDAYLDAAFSALEEGNPFLEKYNELTGAEVTPLISIGVPYFFGGQNSDYLLTVQRLSEPSRYGAVGARCIYGFDCTGYTRWIQTQCGEKTHPSLSDMILKWHKYEDYRMDELDETADFAELARQLQPGDFLACKMGGRHILMFIGTLRDYGFTESEAAEAAAYLDYPLMINCGNDPNYIERTQEYIEENHLNAQPSRGGVTVSIVGMRASDAPHARDDGVKPFSYFDLDGYQLSVWDLSACTSHVWWRTVDGDKTR